MTTLLVAVAHHDARPHPGPAHAPYAAVCVFAAGSGRPPGFAIYVAEGGRTPREGYGELGVLRWLQTASSADVVGLAHYRRLFTARRWPRTWTPRT